MDLDVAPGEVWWAKPSPTVGREQAGRRPVVIVSGVLFLESVTTLVLAIPVTTTDRGWPNHIQLDTSVGLEVPSWAMTEQIRAVSRERLTSQIGHVTPATLEHMRAWVRDYLVD